MTTPFAVALLACTHAPPPTLVAEVAEVADPTRTEAWLVDADGSALAARLASGDLDPASLRDRALARIAALDRSGPRLGAVIATDPAAAPGAPSGPLYGLPVLVKDNVDVRGFATTAGSLALADHRPTDDAFLVARIREAGGVLLGKANLAEWANFRGDYSTNGWSAVGGQSRNPHVLDRSPCGSSAGSAVAVAAGYAPFAIGTETDGSILCPASTNGVVGVKPTVGLVSRDGVVPIASSQDTAGPITRTVTDAARLLEVIAAADPSDPASARRPADLQTVYVAGLRPDALAGVRIGVARELGRFNPKVTAVFDRALEDLRALGAELVEVELKLAPAHGAAELEILLHEFGPELERYLATVDPALGVRTIEDLVAFGVAHRAEELPWFGQELLEQAAAHPADDAAAYAEAVAKLRAFGPEVLDGALAKDQLSAVVAPTSGPAGPLDVVNGDSFTGATYSLTAISGYPAVTVPMGEVQGLPVGLLFLGTAWHEADLLAYAFAYEQRTLHRRVPRFAPTVVVP